MIPFSRMIETVITKVDSPLYRRVPSARAAMQNALIYQLVQKGVDPETIVFETRQLPQNGCCSDLELKAYGEVKTREVSPETGLDD